MTFDQWKKQVDSVIGRKCGMDSDSQPDVDYYSEFDAGTSPAEMAEIALQESCEEMGFDYDEVFGGD